MTTQLVTLRPLPARPSGWIREGASGKNKGKVGAAHWAHRRKAGDTQSERHPLHAEVCSAGCSPACCFIKTLAKT